MWDDHSNRYDMMNGGSGSAAFAAAVLILLALALVAILTNLYLHVNAGRSQAAAPPARTEPEARLLLDRRLALGEISPEEYTSVRTALES